MSSSEETGKLEEVVVNCSSKSEPHGTCSNTNSSNGISSSEYKRAGSVLEAVPEEMGTVTIPGEMEEECANPPGLGAAIDMGTTPGGAAAAAHLGTSPGATAAHMGTAAQGAAASVANTTQFHIPESNASDVAPSECSSYHRHGKFSKSL